MRVSKEKTKKHYRCQRQRRYAEKIFCGKLLRLLLKRKANSGLGRSQLARTSARVQERELKLYYRGYVIAEMEGRGTGDDKCPPTVRRRNICNVMHMKWMRPRSPVPAGRKQLA